MSQASNAVHPDTAAGAAARKTSAWRSPWVIGWLALLLVVLAVNILMIYLAFLTNPGLVRDDYYERGRDVEQTIVSRLEEGPGWHMSVDTPDDTRAGEETVVRYFVVDGTGQPVTPDSVTYYAYRPSDVDRDFSRPMALEGKGRYAVRVSFPLTGVWDTVVSATLGDDEYSIAERISVRRP